ncbi:hypothetical protein DAMA08_024490 [Martiniozyma asiatica (nom. inval.)]|nr:hypothetical protein DAMA08_024490 [Martiniozyma asiatica]
MNLHIDLDLPDEAFVNEVNVEAPDGRNIQSVLQYRQALNDEVLRSGRAQSEMFQIHNIKSKAILFVGPHISIASYDH